MFTKAAIEEYFIAFKHEQIFLIVLGIIALITAVIFYVGLKTPWYKGFALPLSVFALLFCTAGIQNYTSAKTLSIRAAYNYDMHPALLKTKELPRVKTMQKNLYVLIYVNVFILLASFCIFLYFRKRAGNEYYMGAAASLFLMAVISGAVYFVMINRAGQYAHGIENYSPVVTNITPSL